MGDSFSSDSEQVENAKERLILWFQLIDRIGPVGRDWDKPGMNLRALEPLCSIHYLCVLWVNCACGPLYPCYGRKQKTNAMRLLSGVWKMQISNSKRTELREKPGTLGYMIYMLNCSFPSRPQSLMKI